VPTDAEGRVINHDDTAAAAAAAAAEGGGGGGGAGVAASAWPCMYATGWLRRGPSGVISTNKGDAEQVVEALLQDWEGGATARCYGGGAEDQDEDDLVAWLTKAGGGREGGGGVTVCDYAGWHRIDIAECAAARTDAPREKIVDPDRLLSVATAATAAASS
jgi:ferredoxin--NADP+ reductase